MNAPNPTAASKVAVLAALAAGVVVALTAAAGPEWNFDCIQYAGVARAWLGDGTDALHRTVYADLQATAPAESAKAITAGSAYRKTLARDARQFATQLPFYANKPAYVAWIALATALGANSVRAAFLVSALALGVLSALLLYGLWQIVSPAAACAIAACLIASPPLREVSVLATPDALSAALVFAALWLLAFRERRRALASVLLVLSIAVRPDNLLPCLALFAWLGTKPARRTLALAGAAAASTTYLVCSWLTHAYAWSALIVHTFLRRLTTSGEIAAAHVAPAQYLDVLWRGARGAAAPNPSFAALFALLTVLSWIGAREGDARSRDLLVLQGFIWLAMVGHFLAFPMLSDRFFVAHYAGVALLSVAILAPAQTRAA